MRSDTRTTLKDMKKYNLILIGGPADNRVTKKLYSGLPVKKNGPSLLVKRRTPISLANAYCTLFYFNPLAKQHLLYMIDLDHLDLKALKKISPISQLLVNNIDQMNPLTAQDLLVKTTSGTLRCAMRFGNNWEWQIPAEYAVRLSKKGASHIAYHTARGKAVCRVTQAHICLFTDKNASRIDIYDPAIASLGDLIAADERLRFLTARIQGEHLLRVMHALKNKSRFFIYPKKSLQIKKGKWYRFAMNPWLVYGVSWLDWRLMQPNIGPWINDAACGDTLQR